MRIGNVRHSSPASASHALFLDISKITGFPMRAFLWMSGALLSTCITDHWRTSACWRDKHFTGIFYQKYYWVGDNYVDNRLCQEKLSLQNKKIQDPHWSEYLSFLVLYG